MQARCNMAALNMHVFRILGPDLDTVILLFSSRLEHVAPLEVKPVHSHPPNPVRELGPQM